MMKFTATGSVNGGKLLIGNKAEMDEFFRTVKTGYKAIIEVTIIEPGATVLHQSYFRKVVLSAFVRGFRELGDHQTERQIERMILHECPISDGRELSELSGRELKELTDWCNYYAAVNLGISLDAEFINQ